MDDKLEPLPEDNINSYPQENRVHFACKKEQNYVRKDTFSLSHFNIRIDLVHHQGHELPTIILIYENEVIVKKDGW